MWVYTDSRNSKCTATIFFNYRISAYNEMVKDAAPMIKVQSFCHLVQSAYENISSHENPCIIRVSVVCLYNPEETMRMRASFICEAENARFM